MLNRAALIVAVAAVLAACDQAVPPPSVSAPPSAPAPKIAIIDLDAVARGLGRDESLKEELESAGQRLVGQLNEFAQKLRGELAQEQQKIGSSASDEDRQRLQQMTAQAQARIQQGQAIAQQKARELRANLVAQFREEVKPFAEKIARERGAVSVASANAMVWYSAADDITEAVTEAMRAAGLERKPTEGASDAKN